LAGLLCRIHPMPLKAKSRSFARYAGILVFNGPPGKLRQSKTWRLAYAAAQRAKILT